MDWPDYGTKRRSIGNLPSGPMILSSVLSALRVGRLGLFPWHRRVLTFLTRAWLSFAPSRRILCRPVSADCITNMSGFDFRQAQLKESASEQLGELAAPARCLGRAGHVELLLLLGNVGQERPAGSRPQACAATAYPACQHRARPLLDCVSELGLIGLKTTYHTPTTPGTAYAVYKQVK